ncbi:uncharacterized protein LOC126902154 [Daktulosphaira vitifoliae]|uniref:uncharacterized protein LOC126902154 n=1 Tax=Daktulosphaira vitifoliae TaxID=58002 RepID=UPI0021AAB2B9|nr:uncharacterized protein LOC126902154 [Daktulosphaira vitifoliae]
MTPFVSVVYDYTDWPILINYLKTGILIYNKFKSQIPGYFFKREVDFFYCPKQCGRKYKYKKGLVRHLKYECGVSPQFQCPICNKLYKQPETYKMHLLTIHGINKNDKKHH